MAVDRDVEDTGGSFTPSLSAFGVVVGGSVTLTYRLSNFGSTSASSSVTGSCRPSDSTISTGDTRVGTVSSGALSSIGGRTETFAVETTGWSAETYYIGAEPPMLSPARSPALVHQAPCRFQGYVDEQSPHHAGGWAWNLADEAERVVVEAILVHTGEVLDRAPADQFRWGLGDIGIGDGLHAFYLRFPRMLSEYELNYLSIRCVRDGLVLPISPYLVRDYTPLNFVAMDIVNNCNLRCPFCLYDYVDTRATNLMSEETLDAALRFLSFTTDGNFWFSCLHEPTLHPKLMDYIDRVPSDLRRKLFYTTNLAKRMPATYFVRLAESGMSHINISIESLEPELYERMRKGARHRIFMENWDKLISAMRVGSRPPRLRYITMAYKSNLSELPRLVDYLHKERLARQVELRYSFDVSHMPSAFRQQEFLEPKDWLWLRDSLLDYSAEQLLLCPPPAIDLPPIGSSSADLVAPAAREPSVGEVAAPAEDGHASSPTVQVSSDAETLLGEEIDFRFPPLPPASRGKYLRGRYEFQLASNGLLRVSRAAADHRTGSDRSDGWLLRTHIRNIDDPAAFLRKLPL